MFQSKRKTQIENNSLFLIEKRMKKSEENIQHINEEIEGIRETLFFIMGSKSSDGGLGMDDMMPMPPL